MYRGTLLGAGGTPAAAGPTLTHSMQLVRASSQYMQAADSASLSVTGDLTLEGYFKASSLPGSGIGTPMIFKGDYNTTNSYELYYMNDGGTAKIVMVIFSGAGNANWCEAKFTQTLTVGTWFHVAVVTTVANAIGTKFECFINGTSIGNGTTAVTGTAPTSIYDSSVECGVGMCGNPVFLLTTYCFDGFVSNARVWNVARTQAQIDANKNVKLTTATNLQANWTLDNTLNDASGNSNTLTAYGSPSFSTDVPF